ncbi:hypothetical protein CJ739_978 [Mariniflexile rhizosphaerae]|nr:hypothetical protein CJ739_978 [Mariniflexile sp. TRM1-10]PLB20924.1 MAG: hypothetical protein TRG1_17 [Flavobacteriaceae bacterium FS1-H7996/R]
MIVLRYCDAKLLILYFINIEDKIQIATLSKKNGKVNNLQN